MPIAQSSQPTVKEDVNKVRSPQATVRAQNSYAYKRPDHVVMNNAETNSWAYLAKSLGQFDASFSKYAERKTQENIDEAVAKGQLLFENNDAENRNQQDWKNLVEVHPEYAGLNPHVKKGYEQARLRNLGLASAKAFNDAFTVSGLQNEEDQSKIDKWAQDFWIQQRQKNGLTEYENPVMLAQEFSPYEAKAKQGLAQRHSESLRVQQESKTKMAFANLAVAEVNQILDPNNGLDIEEDGEGRQMVMGLIEKNVTEALAKGVLNANGPDMAWDILENLYLTTDDEDFLEIAKTMEIGSIKLYSLSNVVKNVEKYEAQIVEKQRVAAEANQKALERQKKQAKETLVLSVLEWGEKHPDEPLTPSVLHELGVPLQYHTDAFKAFNAMESETDKAMKASKAYRVAFGDAYVASAEGQMTQEQAVALYNLTGDETFLTNFTKNEEKARKREMSYWSINNPDTPPTAEILKDLGFPEESLPDFIDIHNKTVTALEASREDPLYVSYAEKIAKNVGGYFGKTQGVNELGMPTSMVISPERKTEVERYARSVFQEAYMKLKTDMGGIPSEAQVADLMYEVEGNVVSFLAERYGSQSGDTQANPASNFINGGNVPKTSQQGDTQTLSPEASSLIEEVVAPEILAVMKKRNLTKDETLEFLKAEYPDVVTKIEQMDRKTPSPKVQKQNKVTAQDTYTPERGYKKVTEALTVMLQDYLKEGSKDGVQKKTISSLPSEAQDFLTSKIDENTAYYLKRANPSVEDVRLVLGKNSPELLPSFDTLSQGDVNILPFLEKAYGKEVGTTMLYHLSYDEIRQKLQKEHPELLTEFTNLIGE